MSDSADRHHHRFKVLDLTCTQKRPKHDSSRLHEVRPEDLQAVPGNRDCEARAKCIGIVTASENHDHNVDKCLEEMKKSKLWNSQRRYCQGHKEEPGSNRNPHARRHRIMHQKIPLL